MAILVGVAIPATVVQSVIAELPSLGVTFTEGEPDKRGEGGLFVAIDGWDTRPADVLAAKLSETATGSIFSVLAQTSADAYSVGEYVAGKLVRRISYGRDLGGWSTPDGPRRAWEASFHFALPADEFVDRLGDDEEWSDEDLKVARRAHEKCRLDLLPRLPDPSGSQVAAFLKGLGVELPAIGSYRKPGLLQKLFGR
jgi:hypothetical protein